MYIGLHRFLILPIYQVPSIAIKCIHKYKYRYRYMVALYSGQYTSIFGAVKCYVSTIAFNYSCYYLYNNRIGICVTYFTDSDITKKRWYWPDTDTDARIGATLYVHTCIIYVHTY